MGSELHRIVVQFLSIFWLGTPSPGNTETDERVAAVEKVVIFSARGATRRVRSEDSSRIGSSRGAPRRNRGILKIWLQSKNAKFCFGHVAPRDEPIYRAVFGTHETWRVARRHATRHAKKRNEEVNELKTRATSIEFCDTQSNEILGKRSSVLDELTRQFFILG